jgi:hypothetical protein
MLSTVSITHYFRGIVTVVFVALFSCVHIGCRGSTLCGFCLCIPVRCFHLFGGAASIGVVSKQCDLHVGRGFGSGRGEGGVFC